MNYSPFYNEEGKVISFEELEFSDILKIENSSLEEGYKVEFKSRWDTNFVDKHLCKTIASFANSQGGWLFVGIEDNSGKYVGIDKQRADFSQTISQKIREITPLPKFDCRYIHEYSDNERGVLIIQVYEGVNPPYMCNGTVYTRSGSSKMPIKSDRSSIDELNHKRDKFVEARTKFCFNSLADEKITYPYCCINIYNPYSKIEYSAYTENEKRVEKIVAENNPNERKVNSFNALMCFGSDIIKYKSVASIVQYFFDGNVKIFVPLFLLKNSGSILSWINWVNDTNGNIDLKDMPIMDGYISYITVSSMINSSFNFISKYGNKINDYIINFEFKNIKDLVFYYRHDIIANEPIINKLHKGELFISNLTEFCSEPISFIEVDEFDIRKCSLDLMSIFFLRMFGINDEDFLEIYDTCNEFYNESSYFTEL